MACGWNRRETFYLLGLVSSQLVRCHCETGNLSLLCKELSQKRSEKCSNWFLYFLRVLDKVEPVYFRLSVNILSDCLKKAQLGGSGSSKASHW